MKKRNARPREGIRREIAGTKDHKGFIAPSIGALEHVLYFSSAPSVAEKARQVVEQGRLELPGAVVVWNETVGRRQGRNAVAKSWWADTGSLTAAFAFPRRAKVSRERRLAQTAAVVLRVIESFRPRGAVSFRRPNDLLLGDRKVGAVFAESHEGADITIVRLNCSNDLSKAPPGIAERAARLIDVIDVRQLPLRKPGTLPNTLLTRLMEELPKALGGVAAEPQRR